MRGHVGGGRGRNGGEARPLLPVLLVLLVLLLVVLLVLLQLLLVLLLWVERPIACGLRRRMHRRGHGRRLDCRCGWRKSGSTKGQGNRFQTQAQVHHTDFVCALVINVKGALIGLGRDLDQGELGTTDLRMLGKVVVVQDGQKKKFSVGEKGKGEQVSKTDSQCTLIRPML